MKLTTVAALLLAALLSSSCESAKLDGAARSSIATPKPPAWPQAYEMSYTITLPYTQSVQPVALKYPVHVWYNETEPQAYLRIQFYNGLDEIYVIPGAQYYIYPRITVKSCLTINTTVGPTAGGVGDLAGMPPPLPDIRDWQFAGSALLPQKPPTYVWQLTVRQWEKVETYDFHVSQVDGHPVHLSMMGVNLLTGSHFDAYDVDFTYFAPLHYSSAFTPPRKLCESRPAVRDPSAGMATAAHGQMLSLLPGASVPRGLQSRRPVTGRTAAPAAVDDAMPAATAIVAENLRYIHEWNQARQEVLRAAHQAGDGKLPVAPADMMVLGPNQYVGWTDERWRSSVIGNQPPRSRQARLEARRNSRAYLGVMQRRLRDEELPKSVDWRGTGADGPVKDQASCGSCWTFATTGAMTGAWFLATNVSLSFSEQQIVDCSWNYEVNGCWGGNVEPALSYVYEHGGIALESAYPYAGQNGLCRENTTAKAAAFKGYLSVPEGDELALMEAVATHGPVGISFDAVHPTFKFYSDGVYYRQDCGQDVDHLNHAVTLVGYGTTPDGTDYWILRNSWSQLWGASGYFKLARKGNDCGITLDAVIAVVDPVYAEEFVKARARQTSAAR